MRPLGRYGTDVCLVSAVLTPNVGYWFLERNFKMMNLVNSINRTPGAAEGRFIPLTFHLSYSFLSLHKLIRIIRYDQRLSGADAVLFRQMVDALYLIYIFLLILILFIINIILGQIP